MLPVEFRVKQLKLNLVHNIVNGKAPNYLSDSFNLTSIQHSINTDLVLCLFECHAKKSFEKNPFFTTQVYRHGIMPYNISIQSAQNKYQINFKCLVKQILFSYFSNQVSPFIYY